MDESTWKKQRAEGIGSSEGAAILGCGYASQSISSVWLHKTKGVEPEFDEKTLALLNEGRLCEPLVIQSFADRNPDWKVEPVKFEIVKCTEYPYMHASLDAKISKDGNTYPLEVKWVMHPNRLIDGEWVNEWEGEDECPIQYEVQTRHQMICMGVDRGCLAAFVQGRWQQRWFERDEELETWMIDRYRNFWSYVISNEPPPDDSETAQAYFTKGQVKGCAKLVGKKTAEKIEELLDIQDKLDGLSKRAQFIKNSLSAEYGGVEYLILPSQQVIKISRSSYRLMARLPRGVEIVM